MLSQMVAVMAQARGRSQGVRQQRRESRGRVEGQRTIGFRWQTAERGRREGRGRTVTYRSKTKQAFRAAPPAVRTERCEGSQLLLLTNLLVDGGGLRGEERATQRLGGGREGGGGKCGGAAGAGNDKAPPYAQSPHPHAQPSCQASSLPCQRPRNCRIEGQEKC